MVSIFKLRFWWLFASDVFRTECRNTAHCSNQLSNRYSVHQDVALGKPMRWSSRMLHHFRSTPPLYRYHATSSRLAVVFPV
jgi:hypothetical protein